MIFVSSGTGAFACAVRGKDRRPGQSGLPAIPDKADVFESTLLDTVPIQRPDLFPQPLARKTGYDTVSRRVALRACATTPTWITRDIQRLGEGEFGIGIVVRLEVRENLISPFVKIEITRTE
jgi:hypothetical protein